MKKTLIALAAMATTTAFAQSTVTLSGNVKAGLAQTKYSGAATGNGSATGLADGSSRFILSGSEDLGGGLRANFQVDTRFRIDDNGAAPTASPLAGGQSLLPQSLDGKPCEGRVPRHQDQRLQFALSGQHAIKGVAVF
jgi:predicted porin